MEYLDLYDENRNFTGKKIKRSDKKNIEKCNYYTIVLIFIENDEGKFLIQKTSLEKGSVWATTGGHVKAGQSSKEAIIEEVREELGIDISNYDFKLIMTKKFNQVFVDAYYLKKNIDVKDIILQDEEVEVIKWLSIKEIEKLIQENSFRNSNVEFLNYILESNF